MVRSYIEPVFYEVCSCPTKGNGFDNSPRSELHKLYLLDSAFTEHSRRWGLAGLHFHASHIDSAVQGSLTGTQPVPPFHSISLQL